MLSSGGVCVCVWRSCPLPLHCVSSQGVDSTSVRAVSTTVPVEQVPDIMRAVGYYPSEEEVHTHTHTTLLSNLWLYCLVRLRTCSMKSSSVSMLTLKPSRLRSTWVTFSNVSSPQSLITHAPTLLPHTHTHTHTHTQCTSTIAQHLVSLLLNLRKPLKCWVKGQGPHRIGVCTVPSC